jgi:DNA-binding NarL/FixJ family response regulator
MSDRPLRVVLVDDHEMVLQGLATILGRFLGRVRVIGQAMDADTAQRLAATLKPDIVLCDVRLRGSSGLDLCRKLLEEDPGIKLVLLSAYDDEQYLFQALRVGAAGYLLKQINGEDLVRYLERVAEGETVIDPGMAGRAVKSAARLRSGEFWPGASLGLTQRESEVLALTVAGLSNRAIAQRLVVGEETVKSHLRSIYRKLDVGDRAGAVTVALREGVFH